MSDHTDRLTRLFDELSELSEEQRKLPLAKLIEESPELAEELISLLAAYDGSEGYLNQLDALAAAELLHDDERLAVPDRAGPFHLVREIGRGGLGVVYLGERVEGGFDQQVAIKLIKRGMDSDQILRRFQHERRILASLEHPHIARLIDGGLMDDGRPWFAMEFIEGTPINQWCDERCLRIEERLKLFEQVSRAVQFAHARLVVHRDLKPDNILVSDDGTSKLLDFGIAKLIDEAAPEATALTMVGIRAMTPEYAAPEQVRGEPVSVATDVYALGLILYELLAGCRPYQAHSETPEQLNRAICETQPPMPSVAVMGSHAERAAVARHSRPPVLRRRLRGDLDTIVLKAMAKEPERRYGSVEELSADVRRYLDGQPVKARRETFLYLSTRFLLRHRVGVAATVAVMIALAVGMGAALWQAQFARDQAQRATAEADRSERSLMFLTSLFHEGDPRKFTRVESIDELLAAGVDRARSDLGEDPILQGSIMLRLAEVHYGRQQFEKAHELAATALDLLEPRLSSADRRLADAYLVVGSALTRSGQAARGEPKLRLAAAIYGQLGEVDRMADALTEIAGALRQIEGPRAALALQQQILDEVEVRHGSDHIETVRLRQGLAVFAEESGDYELAEYNYRAAIEALERLELQNSTTYASATLSLAGLLDRLGQYGESGELFERAIESRTRLYGEGSLPLVEARFSYGIYLMGQQLHDSAEASFRSVVEAKETVPSLLGHGQRYLGIVLRNQGRYIEAIAEFEAAEHTYLNLGSSLWTLQAYRSVADRGHALVLAGDADTGTMLLIEAIAGIEGSPGDQEYLLIAPLLNLGNAQAAIGKLSAAALTLERAAALANKRLGPDHHRSIEAATRRDEVLAGL